MSPTHTGNNKNKTQKDVKSELKVIRLFSAQLCLIKADPQANQNTPLDSKYWVSIKNLSLKTAESHIHSNFQNMSPISQLPKHFMLSSVVANWRVSSRLVQHSRNPHTRIHTHTRVRAVVFHRLPGLGPVPGSILGTPGNKEHLCSVELTHGISATALPLRPRQQPLFCFLMKKSRHGKKINKGG